MLKAEMGHEWTYEEILESILTCPSRAAAGFGWTDLASAFNPRIRLEWNPAEMIEDYPF